MSTALSKQLDRIDQIQQWIVDGASEAEITQAIKQHYGDAQAKPLIIEAMKKIAAAAHPDADALRGFCILATRQIYQRATEANDHATALRAIKQLREFGEVQ